MDHVGVTVIEVAVFCAADYTGFNEPRGRIEAGAGFFWLGRNRIDEGDGIAFLTIVVDSGVSVNDVRSDDVQNAVDGKDIQLTRRYCRSVGGFDDDALLVVLAL